MSKKAEPGEPTIWDRRELFSTPKAKLIIFEAMVEGISYREICDRLRDGGVLSKTDEPPSRTAYYKWRDNPEVRDAIKQNKKSLLQKVRAKELSYFNIQDELYKIAANRLRANDGAIFEENPEAARALASVMKDAAAYAKKLVDEANNTPDMTVDITMNIKRDTDLREAEMLRRINSLLDRAEGVKDDEDE